MTQDMPISLKSDTFNALTSDTDQMLRSTLEGMERMDNDTAEINIKIKISLAKDEVRDPDLEAHTEMRAVVKPKFDHTVSSVMQYKDKKTGSLSGDYELVWDRNICQFVMRPITNGQTSMFDDCTGKTPGPSGKVIDAAFTEVPALEGRVPLGLPSADSDTGAQDGENAVSDANREVQRFAKLLQYQGTSLVCLEGMGIYTIRCLDDNVVLLTTARGTSGSGPIQIPEEKLAPHVGHSIVCVAYGDMNDPFNIAIECDDCGTVVFDMDRPDGGAEIPDGESPGDQPEEAGENEGEYPYQEPGEEGESA